jgi:hypothetical protein
MLREDRLADGGGVGGINQKSQNSRTLASSSSSSSSFIMNPEDNAGKCKSSYGQNPVQSPINHFVRCLYKSIAQNF